MRKMLKHDLKFVWPVWRIVAPVIFLLSVLAGALVGFGYSEYDLSDPSYELLQPISGIFYIGAVLIDSYWPTILSIFSVLTTVLIVVRYYKNFFTDEGYLTFTLPVSRTNLLNSKILMALIWMAATGAVCLLSSAAYSLMVDLTLTGDEWIMSNITGDVLKSVIESIFEAEEKVHIIFFILEVLFMALAWVVSNLLLLLLCITIGSVIVKRAKLVLGLGIYYGANAVIVVTVYIGIIIGIVALSAASEVSDTAIMAMLHVMFLLCGALFSGLGVGAYLLNKKLINKHLNLP